MKARPTPTTRSRSQLTHPCARPWRCSSYAPDEPKRAVYYPFAEFSPEWQAIRYALKKNVPVRFMDLPQSVRFALQEPAEDRPDAELESLPKALRQDPLRWVAEAAGHSDDEL